ncbi:MAG: spore maturation protein A [Oscillospiraceae bacterium]
MLSQIWIFIVVASMLRGAYLGIGAEVASAAMTGAAAAVELCIGLMGALCLWSAVMAMMEEAGLSDALAKLFSPILRQLFPLSSKVEYIRESISSNVTANLLGLGNAATPAGLIAVEGMAKLGGKARREMGRFVVMNTASIQLLPTTIAAIRAANGAGDAFDILPAVWLSSALALAAGLVASELFARILGDV